MSLNYGTRRGALRFVPGKKEFDCGTMPPLVVPESPDPPQPLVAFINAKCPASPMTTLASAKKTALDVNNLITPVMTQAVFHDDSSREKLTCVITMPANVTHKSQLKVEFVTSSNGARMIVWVPQGGLVNNMDKLNKGYAGMPSLSQKTADFAMRALEDKLMVLREKIWTSSKTRTASFWTKLAIRSSSLLCQSTSYTMMAIRFAALSWSYQ
jgi:hypothetical protein